MGVLWGRAFSYERGTPVRLALGNRRDTLGSRRDPLCSYGIAYRREDAVVGAEQVPVCLVLFASCSTPEDRMRSARGTVISTYAHMSDRWTLTRKPRPESGLHCLICAMFTRPWSEIRQSAPYWAARHPGRARSRRICCLTRCASDCALCQPLLLAFSGQIRSPPPTGARCAGCSAITYQSLCSAHRCRANMAFQTVKARFSHWLSVEPFNVFPLRSESARRS